MSLTRRHSAVILFTVLAQAGAALGDDWPNWRGPGHDGRSAETDFKTAWEGNLEVVWQREIADGYAGISTSDGRVYTCGTADGNQVLFCLDAETGKTVWQAPIEGAYNNNYGNGTRGTPTIDGGRVYIMGALGTVACFDASTGSRVWERKYDRVPTWGYSGSVLVQGNLAIVAVGGEGGGLRALNKKSGKEVWKCGSDGDSGYSTPYPFEFEGKHYVCSFLGSSVVIANIKTGREVFSMPWKTDYKVNASTPIFHDGHLFLSTGYKTGCGLYKLRKKGSKLDAREVWRSKVLMNKFQTPVLYKGKLYSYDQKAFHCVDFMTGKQEWRQRGKHGTIVLANGHLLALSAQGKLRIAKASPKGFEPTAEAQILDDRCWTVPTLSNGRLYARNHERIVCVDLREGN